MFVVRADHPRSDDSATDLIEKIQQAKTSSVPLRVTYTVDERTITHDIHERTWREWFGELFLDKAQKIEINRRVATAVSAVLSNCAEKQAALRHIHALADDGLELSAARLYKSLSTQNQMSVSAPESAPLNQVPTQIEVVVRDPSVIEADTYLLGDEDLIDRGRGHIRKCPQLRAFGALAIEALEKIGNHRLNACGENHTEFLVPAVEIPRCELKARRTLVYGLLPRMRGNTLEKKASITATHKAFFDTLFASEEASGTLVISMPHADVNANGLKEALEEIRTGRKQSKYSKIIVACKDLGRWQSVSPG